MSVPINNTNLQPISYCFEVIADYCPNFGQKNGHCVFSPIWGLRDDTYAVHLMLIGKLVVDFLFVLTELF